jgi:hypothetical protein
VMRVAPVLPCVFGDHRFAQGRLKLEEMLPHLYERRV